MDEDNPTTKDLTKTLAFKIWEQRQLKGNEKNCADEFSEPIILNTYYIKAGETTTTFTRATQETIQPEIQDEKDPETHTATATSQELQETAQLDTDAGETTTTFTGATQETIQPEIQGEKDPETHTATATSQEPQETAQLDTEGEFEQADISSKGALDAHTSHACTVRGPHAQ